MTEAHHSLGPSTLKWVEICAGYRSSNETNPMAEEGTMLHEAVENNDMTGLDDVQIALVQKCLDYAKPFEDKADEVIDEERLTIKIYDGQV
jgi:hypothetical protein